MCWVKGKKINFIEKFAPEGLALFNFLIVGYKLHMVEDTPNKINDFILLIFIVIEYGNGVNDSDNLINWLYLEERLLDDHLLQSIYIFKQHLPLFALNYHLHYSEQLEDSLLTTDTRQKQLDVLDN